MNYKNIKDASFSAYGRIYTNIDVTEYVKLAKNTAIPDEGNIYVASDSQLEQCASTTIIQKGIFGDMPIQVGFCNGHNSKMNAMEYHKSSEVTVSITDLILILGKYSDIKYLGEHSDKKPEWNSSLADIFFVPKGSCFELFPNVLHFSPCRVDEKPFRSIIILPKDTNTSLDEPLMTEAYGEDRLLFMKNKWLIAHEERKPLLEKGAHPGIVGINHEIV